MNPKFRISKIIIYFAVFSLVVVRLTHFLIIAFFFRLIVICWWVCQCSGEAERREEDGGKEAGRQTRGAGKQTREADRQTREAVMKIREADRQTKEAGRRVED